jgi:hypothetical protein
MTKGVRETMGQRSKEALEKCGSAAVRQWSREIAEQRGNGAIRQ